MKNLFCVIAACVLLAASAAAQPVDLSVGQVRQLAVNLWTGGQSTAASNVAEALLQRDPDDYVGLIIQADLLANAGQTEEALTLARRAWKVASTDVQRNEIARLTAGILFRAKRHTQAQLWLRRAVQSAPDNETRQRTIAEFKHVRRLNPIRINLYFSSTESDNVNNGSSESEIELFGLPFQLSADAQALSGREVSYGGSLSWRFAETAKSRWQLDTTLNARDVFLSQDARRAVPTAKNSDFSFRNLRSRLGYRRVSGSGKYLWDTGFAAGRTWYGGDIIAEQYTLDIGRTQSLSNTTSFRPYLIYTFENRRDNPERDAKRASLGFELRHTMEDVVVPGTLSGSLRFMDISSDSARVDSTGWEIGSGYELRNPFWGTHAHFEVAYGKTDFERPENFFFAERLDETFLARATFRLTELSYFGFSPLIELAHSRRNSNIALYENVDTTFQLGFTSSF